MVAVRTRIRPLPPRTSQRPGLHRFQLTRLGVDIAFDTQTGQLCRTWKWEPLAPETKTAQGKMPERKPGEFAPTCLSLYQKYPSGTGADSQVEQPDAGAQY